MNIPEAIQHPRELALGGSWSALSGSHLTFTASEDFLANGHGGSANHEPEGAMETKNDLRLSLRSKRQTIHKTQDFWKFCSNETWAGVEQLITKSLCIAGYVAIGSEVDPAPLLAVARKNGSAIALPVLASPDAPMEFRLWCDGKSLHRASFGFLQPSAAAPLAKPDIIIVPLVGFDRQMNRLGQGAGHYDRALPKFPRAVKIGLAWSVQEVEALPADPWDVPLDLILTERELIRAAQQRTETI